MAIKGRSALKEFFETDDFPTEVQFADFIDSYLNQVDDHYLVGGEDNITAYAGGGQVNAYQITKKINRVTTVASSDDSCKLPKCATGMIVSIRNKGAETMHLYPYSGDRILSAATDVPVDVPINESRTYGGLTSTSWMIILVV